MSESVRAETNNIPNRDDDRPAATAPDAGDGETWEDYAHRLERRIKQQRDHIKDLNALRGHPANIKDRRRIAHLERLLGQATLRLEWQHEGLRALNDKLREMEAKSA